MQSCISSVNRFRFFNRYLAAYLWLNLFIVLGNNTNYGNKKALDTPDNAQF